MTLRCSSASPTLDSHRYPPSPQATDVSQWTAKFDLNHSEIHRGSPHHHRPTFMVRPQEMLTH